MVEWNYPDMGVNEFREILYEDHEDFEAVTKSSIEEQTRWSIYKSQIFKQKSTGKFFEAYWGEGATEQQDGQDEFWSLTEVEPKEVTLTLYNQVKGGIHFEGDGL